MPVYQFKCVVIIDKDIEKRINAYSRKHKWNLKEYGEENGDQVHGLAVNPGVIHTYYIFYSCESTTVNIIAHEISHLVDDILGDRGIEDSEARAYLSGYMNEKIFDYVIKHKLLINKWLPKEVHNSKDTLQKLKERTSLDGDSPQDNS
jgi:hypothetical protein